MRAPLVELKTWQGGGLGHGSTKLCAPPLPEPRVLDSLADDAPLRALCWALTEAGIDTGAGPLLFLGARPGEWLSPHATDWACEQPFRPFADALERQGAQVAPRVDDTGFALALILPPRSRDAARAWLARAVRATREGGHIVLSASNDEGARSLEVDLQRLLGSGRSLSKFKSRVVIARRDAAGVDATLLAAWLALDEPRCLPGPQGDFWTRPGLFAWDRVDAASALLAEHLPETLSGRIADLGAGWGYLSMQLARRCAAVTTLDLFEADASALEPARRNMQEALASRPELSANVHWHDVTSGLPQRFDAIVSNPPFHVGRADLPALGRTFIQRAAEALVDHGQLWLVANRHLPYEATLSALFGEVRACAQRDGFKVIHARKPIR